MQRTPAASRNISGDAVGNKDLDIGDTVDVPGGMHGTVKFIGEVQGKKGIFAGVELNKEWAARGKNDGDVDGVQYFTTLIPGAGIFLPSSKAYKRFSPGMSSDSSPTTPSLAPFNAGGRSDKNLGTPPTPASKLSQSVGPGRAASPALKPRSRPSLPRPESPLRRAQNANAATPSGRPSLGAPKLGKGAPATPRYAPSPTPGKFSSSIGPGKAATGDPGKRPTKTPTANIRTPGRPASRALSRQDSRNPSRPESRFDDYLDDRPISPSKAPFKTTYPSRPQSQDTELERLRSEVADRDQQLKDQATSLLEMETSMYELQSLLPTAQSQRPARPSRHSSSVDHNDADASQLRTLLREKNEKIAALTADFDAHRADFRSTIDTLELASTETERVYEKKVEDLSAEIRELQERGEDMESVAQQLKQLEDLVQELEEGLEDARRGEAEARGEVEFLRGEVERGRSELKREKDKAAVPQANNGVNSQRSSREVEQRDDEIRGLKAIIHSLSRDADVGSPRGDGSRRVSRQRHSGVNGVGNAEEQAQLAEERKAREKLERDVKDLENLVDAKTYREEELENELKRLRSGVKHNSAGSNSALSPHTALSPNTTLSPVRRNSAGLSRGNSGDWRRGEMLDGVHEIEEKEGSEEGTEEGGELWCEICEVPGHDILTCTNMFGGGKQVAPAAQGQKGSSPRTGRDVVVEGLRGLNINQKSPRENGAGKRRDGERRDERDERDERMEQQQHSRPLVREDGMVAGKATGVVDESKWCALCERDGHESVDCPEEEMDY